MRVIDPNDLNRSNPFSIAVRERDGDLVIENGTGSVGMKHLFRELQSMYPSRFRGAIVYSESVLRSRIRETRRVMAKYFGEKYTVAWAVKSAPVDRLVSIAADEGAAFDVGSYEELTLARRYADGERIYHTSPGKFDWDIEAIVANRCVSITDNLTELRELDAAGARHNVTIDVGIRVNPAVDSKTTKEISTGSLDCKFGLPEFGPAFFEEVRTLRHVNIRILHMHIGSQIASPDDYAAALGSMVKVYKSFTRNGFTIDTIDVGGGFPYSYQDESVEEEIETAAAGSHAFFNHIRYSFEDYIRVIAETLTSTFGTTALPTISIEPGRHIAAGAAFALGYVLNRKMYPNGIQWLMSSISVNDLFFKLLASDTFFDVHVVTQEHSDRTVPTAIGGTLCFSGDILTPRETAIRLPENISRNDLIMFANVGAYAILGSGNFHNMPRLPIVMIGQDSALVELRGQETPYFE